MQYFPLSGASRKTMKQTNKYRSGFIYYLLSAAGISLQFLFYLCGSPQLSFMDAGGWLFYAASCVSHAAMFALIPYLLYLLPWHRLRLPVLAPLWMGAGMSLLNTLFLINGYVFSLYRFHINGIVLDMFFGEGAAEIFTFDAMLYVKVAGMILLIIGVNVLFWQLSRRLAARPFARRLYLPAVSVLLGCTLLSHGMHAYSAAAQKKSVIKSATYLPYFFPLTANTLMTKLGVVSAEALSEMTFEHSDATDICYPKQPVQYAADSTGRPLNVVMIVLDSWNYRTLTPECMPRIHDFSTRSEYYTHHLSSSNGTRGSIFGLFFGVSSYYWKDFDLSGTRPVLIRSLLDRGYRVQAYTGATLLSPPFAKIIFSEVPDLHVKMEGKTVYDRDCRLTETFLDELERRDTARPFFSFLFYDMPHSYELPKEKLHHFQPSWEYADYTKLDNEADPTPFFNLYRNCLAETDSLVGLVLHRPQEQGLMENTVVLITGDHGQEFNENRKNYWGHGSNYTRPQIGVPFLYYYPGCRPRRVDYRTTHYDVSPTLLRQVLGAENDPSDYSMGRLLSDPAPRDWHIVGDNLNYAFIIEEDRIVEKKPAGYMEVYDARLNPIESYKPAPKDLSRAIQKLNSFYK